MNSSVMVTAGANQDFRQMISCPIFAASINPYHSPSEIQPILVAFPPWTSQPSYGERGNCGCTTWTLSSHRQSGGHITISCLPLDNSRASDFGLMKIDCTGRVISFSEKPMGDDLKAMGGDTSVLSLSSEEKQCFSM
ncbi:uncharacterized protein LOC144552588 isoform X1 [Carex rostrata]